jgi:hypothetical protein
VVKFDQVSRNISFDTTQTSFVMSRGSSEDSVQAPTTPSRTVLFIDQTPESFRKENVRAIASRARRWQTARKQQERRDLAQQQATYARGLVGWNTAASAKTGSVSLSMNQKPTADPVEKDVNEDAMQIQISGGLRTDPFDALPSPRSRAVHEMVDYCES